MNRKIGLRLTEKAIPILQFFEMFYKTARWRYLSLVF